MEYKTRVQLVAPSVNWISSYKIVIFLLFQILIIFVELADWSDFYIIKRYFSVSKKSEETNFYNMNQMILFIHRNATNSNYQ